VPQFTDGGFQLTDDGNGSMDEIFAYFKNGRLCKFSPVNRIKMLKIKKGRQVYLGGPTISAIQELTSYTKTSSCIDYLHLRRMAIL